MPDELVLQAKRAALEADTTLTELITNAVREALARKGSRPPQHISRMPSYTPPPGEEGLMPGVDLDDTAALLDLLESPVPDDTDRR